MLIFCCQFLTALRYLSLQLYFANDQFPRVRAELLRVITQCLKDIKSVPRR